MKVFLKKLYKAIPFKKQLFILIRFLFVLPKKITSHLYFDGVFNVECNGNGKFKIRHYGYQVENLIFWYGLGGGFEKESIKLWMKLCAQSNVIFDIGANTGVYSLTAKTINPGSRVYAFEPIKRIIYKLQTNISLNNYNVHLIEKAASNVDGFAVIYDDDADNNYSATLNKNFSYSERGHKEITIETIKIDSFIEQNNIEKIDLIKIDVEMYEPEVLEGFSKYLRFFKPTILIEILDDHIGARVYELVKDLGYLYFNINEEGAIKREQSITKSSYYNYLLCTPTVAQDLGLI